MKTKLILTIFITILEVIAIRSGFLNMMEEQPERFVFLMNGFLIIFSIVCLITYIKAIHNSFCLRF